MAEQMKKIKITGKLVLGIFFLGFLIVPLVAQGQTTSSDLLAEYLFPIQYGEDVMENDIIGLRIYKNPENQDPMTWYENNVASQGSPQAMEADGYKGVRDDRTVYVQAANLVNLTSTPVFYTNIYVLAYNQDASDETKNIYNQMLANMEFNKNIMDLYCLKAQAEIVKDKLRRDTLRKVDLYTLTNLLKSASSINLRSGTYVPGMTMSTWPSWQENLAKQLKATLPLDPLNIMSDRVIGCTKNEQCETGQCSGGYCSACKSGWDPKTCWNDKTQNYQAVDGFVYKYQTAGSFIGSEISQPALTIRYEWSQLIFPATGEETECFLGCDKDGVYYVQGSCLTTNQYCNAGVWTPNECGDGIVRCNEVCDCADIGATDCYCASGCLTCKDHYHAVGALCQEDTEPVTTLTQTLSTQEEKRWTGSGWSDPYAIACVANAILDNYGVCKCKKNYHEETGQCLADSKWWGCAPKPAVGAIWNTVEGYEQNWDGEKWVPIDSVSEFNILPSDSDCRFICDQYYIYNGINNECEGIIQQAFCAAKPDHTIWNNGTADGHFNQVYNGTDWFPATVETKYDTLTGDNSCNFKCDTNYTWDGNSCEPVTQIFYCAGNPSNTDWFYINSYEQTWDGTSWVPADDITASYSTTPSDPLNPDCRYKCKINYIWDGSSICNADTMPATCTDKPSNSVWTGASTYTQTWNGTAWLPEKVPVYSPTDITACHFKCDADYTWTGSACERVYICLGSKANADKCKDVGDTIDETGLIADTDYSAKTDCTSAKCEYKCKPDYTLIGNECTGQCEGGNANGTPCPGDYSGLTINTSTAAKTACSSPSGSNPKCEYTCNTYYHAEGGVCVLNECTDPAPTNTTPCPGQEINLNTDNITSTAVNFCTSGQKCQYYCNQHFVLRGGSCQPGNLVFVTSGLWTGNLGGVAGADAKCNTEANNKGTHGYDFKAWVSSSSTNDPESRFTHPTTFGYYLINGSPVAEDWGDLTDGVLENAISLDLNYASHADYVRTGTYNNGTEVPLHDCDSFTASSGWYGGPTADPAWIHATHGIASSPSTFWTSPNGTVACEFLMRLYCFAQ